MKVLADEFYAEYYEKGHLDYVLGELAHHNTVDSWVEYLKHEPIGFFENRTDWSLVEIDGKPPVVTYTDPENSTYKEEYEVGMVILFDDSDILFHCPNGNASMFYQLGDDSRLRAIYVD